MILSILIPLYKETDEMITRFLSSIKVQQLVDFNEIEVNFLSDGTDFEKGLFLGYPFAVNYNKSIKKGVSGIRNSLLDNAKGDYIQWCDGDDFFCSSYALYAVFNQIPNSPDVIVGNFYAENKVGDTIVISEHGQNGFQFVHNKVYRRKFLIDNNIRFGEWSCVHEDHPIFSLSKIYSDNIIFQPIPTYTWAYNPNSVCRRDDLYLQKTTKNLLMSSAYMLERLIEHNREDAIGEIVYSMLFDIYYSLNDKKWIDSANKEFRDECEGYFKHYYNHYKKYCDNLGEDKKTQITASQKMMHTQMGVILESVTFNDWLQHLEEVNEIDFHIENLLKPIN